MTIDYFNESLKYHRLKPTGKIGISITKPCDNQTDLSLAYTPGVGQPCLEIHKDQSNAWQYTNKGNTVGIITDGTAVLGLGDIGSLASLPVMEGKSILFKKFADIDSYPLCFDFESIDKDSPEYIDIFCNAILALQPSLGAINLEDIKAPQCFALMEQLEQKSKIPVFHDDQDGTAIIITAGIINALEITGKSMSNIKIVINGAGAAGISCARLLLSFGVDKKNIFICDRQGLVTSNSNNKYKQEFAQDTNPMTLSETIVGADIFIGVSGPNLLSQDMVRTMNSNAIIFAVANPIPEIMPEDAYIAGAKIIGTGRSDYPNQVNNSLGFPGLFRATLDTRSVKINQEMKIAATVAIAEIVKEPATGEVLEILNSAYPKEAALNTFSNGFNLNPKYVIPKQFDLRVVPRVARVVAEMAMKTGVATNIINDLDLYEKEVYLRVKNNWNSIS